jgi:hypothetical protein
MGSLVAHFGAGAVRQTGQLHSTSPTYANDPHFIKWLSITLRNAPWLNAEEILPWLISEFRKEIGQSDNKRNLQ